MLSQPNHYCNVERREPHELDGGAKLERREKNEDVVLVEDGNGNMVDPSFITRKYLGVTYHKRNKKWIAQASENGRSKYLGCFKTPEKAARMYDAYVVSKGGENVKTNFPVTEIDPTLKPLVKRYKKRTRDVMNFQQIQMQDPWESYLAGLSEQYAKRRKRSRDPTAPKGPRNAYMMYIQQNREKLQKECVDSPLKEGNTFGAISRELGRRWKALSPEERKKFEDLAAEDKVRHEREKREYESKMKDCEVSVEESQRNQEAYLSSLEVIQQHYQEYAKMQSQWLSMLGYSQNTSDPNAAMSFNPAVPGSDPTSAFGQTGSMPPPGSAPGGMGGMYNFSPAMPMGGMPSTLSTSPTAPQPATNASPIPDPQSITSAPNLQTYFSEDGSDIYDQLGYTPEEMAALQSAWFAAAQQAQMTALEQAAQMNKKELDIKGTGDMFKLNDVEDQSERKDTD